MRRDPHNHERKYRAWQRANCDGVAGLEAPNSREVLRFLRDMELGRNTAAGSKKGGRSFARLNNLKQRLVFIARLLQDRFEATDLRKVQEEMLHEIFEGMRSGRIPRRDGKPYRSTGDYVNVFKSYWHWHMKSERKKGNAELDICQDLDYGSEKAPWVYLTEEDVERLCRHARFSYRVLMQFLYDTGMRAPTELLNVRVDDYSAEDRTLRVSDEASKTFGRTIKLMRCTNLLDEYIAESGLQQGDFLFTYTATAENKNLTRLGGRLLGTHRSPGGKPYDRLTLYDFRHSSACYWLPRYKSESGLKYRFGWKQSRMIEYYTGFLGMRDTITEDDLALSNLPTDTSSQQQQVERLLGERLLQLLNKDSRSPLRDGSLSGAAVPDTIDMEPQDRHIK